MQSAGEVLISDEIAIVSFCASRIPLLQPLRGPLLSGGWRGDKFSRGWCALLYEVGERELNEGGQATEEDGRDRYVPGTLG